jgi:hypothetical protein
MKLKDAWLCFVQNWAVLAWIFHSALFCRYAEGEIEKIQYSIRRSGKRTPLAIWIRQKNGSLIRMYSDDPMYLQFKVGYYTIIRMRLADYFRMQGK